MPVFRDTAQLYQVLDAFFRRIADDPSVAPRLLEGNLVVRFRYTDPPGTVTVDLRRAPIRFAFDVSDPEPDVEMIQSADLSHQFWLGRLNVTRAIATRKLIARGSVPKALALLPALEPAFELYPQVLRELGYQEMIPAAEQAGSGRRTGRLLARLQRAVRPLFAHRPSIDYEALNHPPPRHAPRGPGRGPASPPIAAH
jgi:hypothetical protein